MGQRHVGGRTMLDVAVSPIATSESVSEGIAFDKCPAMWGGAVQGPARTRIRGCFSPTTIIWISLSLAVFLGIGWRTWPHIKVNVAVASTYGARGRWRSCLPAATSGRRIGAWRKRVDLCNTTSVGSRNLGESAIQAARGRQGTERSLAVVAGRYWATSRLTEEWGETVAGVGGMKQGAS